MENKEIELFVPGRLCIMGEHSDWAGRYRDVNNKIEKGYAIVTGIEEGIFATAKISDKLIVKNTISKKTFSCEMDYQELKKIAESGSYWSYVAGVAACIKEQYNIGGIEIKINKVTIPEKKGLSSSAAICVLVTRAFNQLYNLHLNTMGEMNLAYLGEITTPSRCGKLDQACAFGKKPILMEFDGDRITVKDIKVKNDLHFVFADLMSKKNTIKILGDLNKAFPFADNEVETNVQKGLGEINKKLISESIECIEKGDNEGLGKIMIKFQENFDKYVAPACPEELTSPKLHEVLNDKNIKELSFGAKGVGSQGDGTVQVLAKDEKTQNKIKKYFEKELKMDAFNLTIEHTKPVKKAIIPVAGNGTRMYPITKSIKKAFLPIIDEDGIIKPVILCLLEEVINAGIEEVCLVIDEADQPEYDNLFNKPLSADVTSKLSEDMLKYESKILSIGKKITYVYQKEKLGLGHAVSLCKNFANNDPVLLVLGDQLYKTKNSKNCTEQIIDSFEKSGMLTVSVTEVDKKDVSKYGILCGNIQDKDNYFFVDKMVEKPEESVAEEKYYTSYYNQKKYYAVFGEYILTDEVFKKLDEHIKNNVKERGEFQLTSALDEVREVHGMVAYIPDGEMLDVGNVKAYKRTFEKKSND